MRYEFGTRFASIVFESRYRRWVRYLAVGRYADTDGSLRHVERPLRVIL